MATSGAMPGIPHIATGRVARRVAGDDMVTGLPLAHQVDGTTLLVLVPIAVIVALLHVARRRTKQP